ncbi:acetyltransferase (GNAT) family domain-containing protein [Ditylenchus destructor]|nr:acetyltransferase (GNAT) family domain-containing protein [Ditylenchus destructor]
MHPTREKKQENPLIRGGVGNNQLLFDLRAKSNCKGKEACKTGQRDDIPERPVPNNANKCKPDTCKSNEKCNKMVDEGLRMISFYVDKEMSIDSDCLKKHERWLPNIEIKSIRQGRYRYRLEIPLNDTENMAFLDYSLVHDNDEHGTPIVHLRFIETKAPFQNKGLGTALLKHFIEEKVMKRKLRKMGKIKLHVMRGHQNVEAYGLYKKCGFVNEHPEEPSNHNMILILADYKPENCVSGKIDLV